MKSGECFYQMVEVVASLVLPEQLPATGLGMVQVCYIGDLPRVRWYLS